MTDDVYRIAFARIGGRRDVDDLYINADTPTDAIAERVLEHARGYLLSNMADVDVNPDTGIVLIQGGLFGAGTITRVDAR